MLIKPKEITVIDSDREEHTFIISRLPATIGREILAKYPLSNAPKIGDYEVFDLWEIAITNRYNEALAASKER